MASRFVMRWLSGVLGLCFALAVAACGGEGGDIEIHSIEPAVGGLQGDQVIKINGANFRTDIGYAVYFGRKKSMQVTILNPETLVTATPQQEEAGAVDIRIVSDDGAAFRIPNGFRYEDQGGNVVEQLGGAGAAKKGNLAY